MDVKEIRLLTLLEGTVQYLVPCWQRRYRWNEMHIKRLFADIEAIAEQTSDHAKHFFGSLIIQREQNDSGTIMRIRVVDGQQRLTTVSILLACIANSLGTDGKCGDWTKQRITDKLLINFGKPENERRKLRLQDCDEQEYRNCLETNDIGPGAVSNAWTAISGLLDTRNMERILNGLYRLSIVCIELTKDEDPQLVFECLNATGEPLTESEKVKNWLLMGLSDDEQQTYYRTYWLEIERVLGASKLQANVNEFLRDVLRMYTGERHEKTQVYQDFRDWAVKESRDRSVIFEELSALAPLYGVIIQTKEINIDSKIDQELQHLHGMRLQCHRSLALRLLNDAATSSGVVNVDSGLAEIFTLIGSWTTRTWLSRESTDVLHAKMAKLAHGFNAVGGKDTIQRCREKIVAEARGNEGRLGDAAVTNGLSSLNAYNYRSAVTSTLLQLEGTVRGTQSGESAVSFPDPGKWEIEHVMPQTLTEGWRSRLGRDFEELHRRHLNCLPNLTLLEYQHNSSAGNRPFSEKKCVYRQSAVKMTRMIADEPDWNEDAIKTRTKDLTKWISIRWPWPEANSMEHNTCETRRNPKFAIYWKIGDGSLSSDVAGYKMVLNVARTLLAEDRRNAKRLLDAHKCAEFRVRFKRFSGVSTPDGKFVSVPGYSEFAICPYGKNVDDSIAKCREMAELCGVSFKVDERNYRGGLAFLEMIMDRHDGLPTQDTWNKQGTQYTRPYECPCDKVAITIEGTVGSMIGLYIKAGNSEASDERTKRAAKYSKVILDVMSDQEVRKSSKNHKNGRSVRVVANWTENENEWPGLALWVVSQHARLEKIIERESLRLTVARPRCGIESHQNMSALIRHCVRER